MTPYGKQTAGEVWAAAGKLGDALPNLPRRMPGRKEHDSEAHLDKLRESNLTEIRLIVASQPEKISAVSSKTPEIMEMGMTGGDNAAQLEWASEKLGEELTIEDVFTSGSDIDVIGVTKGYGNQGVVRRFGVKLLSHKNSKRRRQIGNKADFGTGYVRKPNRQAGLLAGSKNDPDKPADAVDVEYLMDNDWIVGDPQECADQIREIYGEVGGFGTLLTVTQDPDNHQWQHECLELLKNDVGPRIADLG